MSGLDLVGYALLKSLMFGDHADDRLRAASMLLDRGYRRPRAPRVTNWFSEAARQVEAAKKQNRRAGRAQGATAGAGVYQGSARHPARGGRAPSAVKAEFGLRGGKVKCLEQLTRILRLDGTLPSCPNHPGVAPADEGTGNLCTECSAHGALKVVP